MNKRIKKKQLSLLKNQVRLFLKEKFADATISVKARNEESMTASQALELKELFEDIGVEFQVPPKLKINEEII